MSYSKEVKNEICNVKISCKECKLALLYGMILASKSTTQNSISILTESKPVVDLFTQLIVELAGAIVTIKTPDLRERNVRPVYNVLIENQLDFEKIANLITGENIIDKEKFSFDKINKPCCKLAFVRGVYLACGTIIDPSKECHIEFSFRDEDLGYTVLELLDTFEIEFKVTTRAKNMILYAKESRQIEDSLTVLGAVKFSMELMNLKIVKDLRNTVNRRTNCETANIGKTVNASMQQIENIEKIQSTIGLDSLPAELKEVALLRLENRDMSLSELCEEINNKISKSGLNHRLKKISVIAEGITKKGN